MKIIDANLHLSASDLASFSSCHHATALDLGVARSERDKSGWFNPMVAALRERGLEHEKRYVDSLRLPGISVADLSARKGETGFAATVEAMRSGEHVIVQATLQRLPWNGIADVLLRREVPSRLGAWSYVPIDTKLATETRAGTVLQLSLYADLLSDVQGIVPEEFCVVVPAQAPELFEAIWLRTADFDAYLRWIRKQLVDAVATPTLQLEAASYPEPVDHCNICRWWERCDSRRRGDDHLSLVAGASRLQRREIDKHGVKTLETLAKVPLPLWKPDRGSREALLRVREQARVQFEGRTRHAPVHELLPIELGQGLTRLPKPSSSDVFFDIEGDPFASNGGREYLFGIAYHDAQGKLVYEAHWAANPSEERAAFEKVVRIFDERRASDPDFHVYHYAPYEPSALKRLMGRYASCEEEIDQLLRGGRIVDLYRIVRQSVRASVERYSIKDLEVFYGFSREMDLRVASRNRRVVEQAIEQEACVSVDGEVKLSVEAYNREDCTSALALRDWLEKLRADQEADGISLPRPDPQSDAGTPELIAKVSAVQALMGRLMRGVPDYVNARSAEEQARWLLAQELEFHRRELKPEFWDFHRLAQLDEEELLDERSALAGLTLVERLPRIGRARNETDRYAFPPQECDIEAKSDLHLIGNGKDFGNVVAIDRAARTIDVKKAGDQSDHHPHALFESTIIDTDTLAESLSRFGSWVVEHGFAVDGSSYGAACELLLRRPPRLRSGAFARKSSEDALAFACRVARDLNGTALPIQGPPGAGKTHTAARMICELVRAGKKVGITAHSHKVIANLLEKVIVLGKQTNTDVQCWAKVKQIVNDASFTQKKDNASIDRALASGEANVVGGTAWFWARKEIEQCVDVLFVDEAGQVSLANALAVAPAADSLVLVGDPRQLDQPLKGAHPDGAAVSALEHLFGEHETVPEERGIFLAETWRLCPSICEFTSKSFYEGRLRSRTGLDRQRLAGTHGFDGSGLWCVPVQHDGNQNSAPEEVMIIEQLVARLLKPGASWVDADGSSKPLAGENILVVAPYNAQVSLLAAALGKRDVRVGTVDKFQGQEAPIVIYSMATSTPEEAPRGMDFLYSLNRLNVATSRARCACILVASPKLFEPECRSVRHIRLANAFCRYRELATMTNLVEPYQSEVVS